VRVVRESSSSLSSSGYCHRGVPAVRSVDIYVLIVGFESLAVARPKSARQAVREGETRMLTWSNTVTYVTYGANSSPKRTPLRSPWTISSPCKYSRPSATSSDCKPFIMYTSPDFQFVTYQRNAIGIRSPIGQEPFQIPIVHPRRGKVNPFWVSVQLKNAIER
jgi:hypothetical protein